MIGKSICVELIIITCTIICVVAIGSPLSEMEEYRVEVCMILRKLERLDKEEFSEDEHADAEEVYKEQEIILRHQKQ